MKSAAAVVIGLVVLAVIGGVWYVGQRNALVEANEQVNAAWSQVENVYQRRMDLIPNLVETVKGVAGFEKETYTEVAEARAKATQINITAADASDPAKLKQFEDTQRQLSAGLGRLLATAEAYPQLKANENFRDLQAQLEGTENRISVERKRFNEAVQSYNVKVKRFPGTLIAGSMGLEQRPYFQANEAASTPPKVQF